MSQLFASGGQNIGVSASTNQSILKEISPGCSLEGLMLKLKLQYFGHLMQRADSFEKTFLSESHFIGCGIKRKRGVHNYSRLNFFQCKGMFSFTDIHREVRRQGWFGGDDSLLN